MGDRSTRHKPMSYPLKFGMTIYGISAIACCKYASLLVMLFHSLRGERV